MKTTFYALIAVLTLFLCSCASRPERDSVTTGPTDTRKNISEVTTVDQETTKPTTAPTTPPAATTTITKTILTTTSPSTTSVTTSTAPTTVTTTPPTTVMTTTVPTTVTTVATTTASTTAQAHTTTSPITETSTGVAQVTTTSVTTATSATTSAATTTKTTKSSTTATTVATTTVTAAPDADIITVTVQPESDEKWNGFDMSFIRDNGMQYVWSQLPDNVKTNVASIMQGSKNLQQARIVSRITKNDVMDLLDFLGIVTAGYVHVDVRYRYWYDQFGDAKSAENQYITSDKIEVAEINEAVQNKVDEIVNNAPEGTERDILKYFHDYLIENCKYNYETEPEGYDYNAYGALILGKCVCQGYAEAMQLLMSRAGFDCTIVRGEANGGSHRWNIVRLSDGKWYNIDVTWDDRVNSKYEELGAGYEYFLISDEEIEKDHKRDPDTKFFTTPKAE